MWNIIGQERAVSLLQHALDNGSVSHAYLFIGPAHSGKMTLARKLAQALNCEAERPPCEECRPCQRVASGSHADIQVIGLDTGDGSEESKQRTEIGINQIKELQRSASLPPFEGKYRVYIIDGAELLSAEASNCLLKTLEEPTGKVVFILLATSRDQVMETIISRCQPVELGAVPVAEIESALAGEGAVTPEKAALLARLSHGCFGWAVSASEDDSVINRRDEWLDKALEVMQGDIEERFAYASQLATQFSRSRSDVQQKLDLWLDWWRDLLLLQADSGDNIINIDRIDRLTDMAQDYSLGQVKAFIGSIRAAGDNLRRNANARLALEVLMLDIPEKIKSGGLKAAV